MPMRGRLSRRRGQDNFLARAQKLDIKPSGDAVHVGCECRCELERNFYSLQLGVADGAKIETVGYRTVDKKRWVECIDNGLREIRSQSSSAQRRQINAFKVVLSTHAG